MDRYKPKYGVARLLMQRSVHTLALDWRLTVGCFKRVRSVGTHASLLAGD